MLLLPILLFWARSPMYFSARWYLILTTMVITIAVAAPLDVVVRQTQAADPFRQSFTSTDQPNEIQNQTPVVSIRQSKRNALREGSPIPPTTGRFVLVGNRWLFVFYADRDAQTNKTTAQQAKVQSSDQSNSDGTDEVSAADEIQILVSENLMLQRIVEAIRADRNDNRWTITGRVTEFFEDNRLVLQTAQRAN